MLKKLSPIGSAHLQKFWCGGLVILVAVFIIGCGGGGSGAVDGGTVTSTQKALKVLPDQVVPGTFITIEDDSIREDSTIEVTFSDPSGFEVVLETEITEESIAKIAVPPLIDVDTGNLKTGKLTVALPNGRHKTLTVEALPALSGLEAGYVVKAYLQQARDNLNTALSHTTTFAMENSYDVSELDMQIQGQIDSLTRSLNELEMWGPLRFTHMVGDLYSCGRFKKGRSTPFCHAVRHPRRSWT